FSATHAPTTQTHTLSLHDALPISRRRRGDGRGERPSDRALPDEPGAAAGRARGPLDAPHDGARGGAAPGVARAARGARLLADGHPLVPLALRPPASRGPEDAAESCGRCPPARRQDDRRDARAVAGPAAFRARRLRAPPV